ncbi:MAG: alpha-amylase family protein, partial [Porphyromonadaceae bacterium]|nr:alpha-amylase family protein [Porphyromonadaceae bacterium]
MRHEKIIIYQLLPRLFGNTTENCVPNGSLEENGVGKLRDITSKALREIARLGCTHIWYTGVIEHATQTDYSQYGIEVDNPHIIKGKAGSPYAIKDYYDIDPDLAVQVPDRMSEFESLIERTHQNRLKALIDFVPNHVARQYHSDVKPDGVIDLGSNDDPTQTFLPQNNFYYIPGQEFAPHLPLGEGDTRYREFPAKATGNDCFSPAPGQNDWYETVKLNYGVDYLNCLRKSFQPIPDTWGKMRDILLFWGGKGIDGFRCDMAEMVPVEFWNWAIPQVKKQFPNLIFIAEIYNPNEYRNYLYNGHFDYLYDKVGLYDLLHNIIQGHAATQQITSCWQSLEGINAHMVNFLENHDEQRIASLQSTGDPFKAYPALIVSAMMNRNPFLLYFGQELGEAAEDAEGFSGWDGRTSIFDYWSVPSLRNWYNNGRCNDKRLTSDQKSLREMYRQALTLCNKESALREG